MNTRDSGITLTGDYVDFTVEVDEAGEFSLQITRDLGGGSVSLSGSLERGRVAELIEYLKSLDLKEILE